MFHNFPLRWKYNLREALFHVGEQAKRAAMLDPKLAAAGVGLAAEEAQRFAMELGDLWVEVVVPADHVLVQAAEEIRKNFGGTGAPQAQRLEEIIRGLKGRQQRSIKGGINYDIPTIKRLDDALEQMRKDVLEAADRQGG